MPDSLFRQSMGRMGEGLSAIEKLAELCQTSLTSTAIRYIQRTELPEAVILSAKNLVDFCFMSDALKVLGKGKFDFLRKETPLPRNSETLNFNNNPLMYKILEALLGSASKWGGKQRQRTKNNYRPCGRKDLNNYFRSEMGEENEGRR
jgi:hypothetical protein